MTPDGASPDRLCTVHLLQLPVPVWSTAQQQADELLREFALAAATVEEDRAAHLPSRLTDLIDALNADFEGVSTAQEEQLFAAAAAGVDMIDDLVFETPVAASAACQAVGDMLDEADVYCREGQHLLTLAAGDEVVRFRRWYLVEFIRQIAGEAPVPWPRYDGSWPTPPAAEARPG